MAPPTPPRNTAMPEGEGLDELKISGQEFRFASCFGQVMQLTYMGKGEFDVVKGLDSGIRDMLANISAKTTEASSDKDAGREARQYQVEGTWKGTAIRGLGRGIATSDKSVIIVNSFWKSDDTTCPKLGPFFVKSLAAQ